MQGSKQGPRACQSGRVAIAFPVAHAISGQCQDQTCAAAVRPCALAQSDATAPKDCTRLGAETGSGVRLV